MPKDFIFRRSVVTMRSLHSHIWPSLMTSRSLSGMEYSCLARGILQPLTYFIMLLLFALCIKWGKSLFRGIIIFHDYNISLNVFHDYWYFTSKFHLFYYLILEVRKPLPYIFNFLEAFGCGTIWGKSSLHYFRGWRVLGSYSTRVRGSLLVRVASYPNQGTLLSSSVCSRRYFSLTPIRLDLKTSIHALGDFILMEDGAFTTDKKT
jgi:hypothetical protein